LKEKPTQEVLQWVDRMFGTAYGDAYLAYLGGKKLFKYQDGKFISTVENTANTLRGQIDYANRQSQRIQQGVGALVGDKPTSAQVAQKNSPIYQRTVSPQLQNKFKSSLGT
jgi:hypothetical protein